jgi:hypothetical protein
MGTDVSRSMAASAAVVHLQRRPAFRHSPVSRRGRCHIVGVGQARAAVSVQRVVARARRSRCAVCDALALWPVAAARRRVDCYVDGGRRFERRVRQPTPAISTMSSRNVMAAGMNAVDEA